MGTKATKQNADSAGRPAGLTAFVIVASVVAALFAAFVVQSDREVSRQ